MKATKIKTFPIGIDRSADSVSVVWLAQGSSLPTVVESPIIDGDAAKTVRAILDRQSIATRDVIMGVRAHEAVLDRAKFPGVKSPGDLEKAARLQLRARLGDQLAKHDVRVQTTASGDAIIGAISKAKIADYQRFAKAAGLKLKAIDNEAFAWKRLVSQVDGVISATESDASLTLFDEIGARIYTFSKSEWIDQMTELVIKLRGDGITDPRVFNSIGSFEDQLSMNEFAERTRSTVRPLEIIDPRTNEVVMSPPWLLAYGLATYGLAA
jgi:uncharacterized protein YdbL (DUF1318 family)